MFRYLLKRFVFLIPTVFFICIVTFFLSINAPGDPVEIMLLKNNNRLTSKQYQNEYKKLKTQLGLDLPLFYFTISAPYTPGNLSNFPISHQEFIEQISFETKNSNNGINVYTYIISELSDLNPENKAKLFTALQNYNGEFIPLINLISNLKPDLNKRKFSSKLLDIYSNTKGKINFPIPQFKLNGFNNQFNNWMLNLFKFNLGNSYTDNRPVSDILLPALKTTFLISILSLILAYAIGIPLGVFMASNDKLKRIKWINSLLIGVYSIPNFWLASILIFLFAGGDLFNWFPAFGVGELPDEAPFLDRFLETSYHLILPLICWTYTSIVIIARHMKGGLEQNLNLDYVRTARAKGLDYKKIVWKHAFKNSVIPIIALFASTLPFVLSGSYVLEYIFNINGLGKATYDALFSRNYPVIFGVVLITAMITIIGNIIADFLLFIIDPRISASQKSK
jgi:peptide/nickel transport system permease protein